MKYVPNILAMTICILFLQIGYTKTKTDSNISKIKLFIKSMTEGQSPFLGFNDETDTEAYSITNYKIVKIQKKSKKYRVKVAFKVRGKHEINPLNFKVIEKRTKPVRILAVYHFTDKGKFLEFDKATPHKPFIKWTAHRKMNKF